MRQRSHYARLQIQTAGKRSHLQRLGDGPSLVFGQNSRKAASANEFRTNFLLHSGNRKTAFFRWAASNGALPNVPSEPVESPGRPETRQQQLTNRNRT